MKDYLFDWTDCVNGIKNGNTRAFEFLYEKTYYDLKTRAMVRNGLNEPDAEAVLVRLYAKVKQDIIGLKDPNALIPWMETLCDRMCEEARMSVSERSGKSGDRRTGRGLSVGKIIAIAAAAVIVVAGIGIGAVLALRNNSETEKEDIAFSGINEGLKEEKNETPAESSLNGGKINEIITRETETAAEETKPSETTAGEVKAETTTAMEEITTPEITVQQTEEKSDYLTDIPYDTRTQYVAVGTKDADIYTDLNGKEYKGVIFPAAGTGVSDWADPTGKNNTNEGYIIYNLRKEYSRFSGTVFKPAVLAGHMGGDEWSVLPTFIIYGDGELLYEAPQITKKSTDFYDFDISVEGINTLKIEITGVWTLSEVNGKIDRRPKICLGEALLIK